MLAAEPDVVICDGCRRGVLLAFDRVGRPWVLEVEEWMPPTACPACRGGRRGRRCGRCGGAGVVGEPRPPGLIPLSEDGVVLPRSGANGGRVEGAALHRQHHCETESR